MSLSRTIAAAAAAQVPTAWAQAAATPEPVSMGSGFLQATLGLALVLALIWGAAWVARRLGGGNAATGSSLLKVVASRSVGTRERVVVVEVGDEWLVLGVASGGVSALRTLPRGQVPAAGTTAALSFGRMLSRARGTPDA